MKKEEPKTGRLRSGKGGAAVKEERKSIAYQNKDVTSKVLAENFKGKSFEVYGLHLPRIVDAESTNLPAVEANELRLDDLFRLADGSYAIVDYESTYDGADKIKYLGYVARLAKRLYNEHRRYVPIRVIVIYTADVKRGTTNPMLDMGDARLRITEAFLSDLDSEGIRTELEEKVGQRKPFTDEDMMRLIVYPLTFEGKEAKRKAVGRAVDIAGNIGDTEQFLFTLSGIFAFADKVITKKDADRIRRLIGMNKFEQGYYEDMLAGINSRVEEIAVNLLRDGISADKVGKCTGLSKRVIKRLEKELLQEA